MTEDRVEDAKKVQHLIDKMQDVIGEGHPTYGHQCYSKALAAAAGYPMGDVRPPLTSYRELGQEGEQRVETLKSIMKELDKLMDQLDSRLAA
jgi:4-hydroxy-tetrahydrodipicolinate synthase